MWAIVSQVLILPEVRTSNEVYNRNGFYQKVFISLIFIGTERELAIFIAYAKLVIVRLQLELLDLVLSSWYQVGIKGSNETVSNVSET